MSRFARTDRRRVRSARMLPLLAALLVAGCRATLPTAEAPQARNVIVMINDGAGWGAWDAAAYWQYGSRDGMPYAHFPTRLGMRTTPLTTLNTPTYRTGADVEYDPAQAWDATPTGDAALPFAGYGYTATQATDSAAAGTALASGHKTYNNAINHDNSGNPVTPVTFLAHSLGKATGVVTSVPFSHATPAAFGAQNASRKHHHAIARQMLHEGRLDLVMGTGGPGYNVNGTACDALVHGEVDTGCDAPDEFVSEADWQAVAAGRLQPAGSARPWQLLRTREEFQALADGTRHIDGPLLGVPQVARTLQQARQAEVTGRDAAQPSGDALITTVPTLATMTRGALRYLQRRSDTGFVLMVEGGATDWAAHTSKCGTQWSYGACDDHPEYGRTIEETVDFNDAVAEVIAWVEAHSNWDDTLLIVTTDHDNSMPLGPDADRVPFQPVVNQGAGRMPGISFRPTGNHTRALVPLWAKGAGASLLERQVIGVDPGYARHVGYSDGHYIDNTAVAHAVRAVLLGQTLACAQDATACPDAQRVPAN